MLLSIAMIVKNEESNIDRCLGALRKLDGKIEYEIIVVDTGSEDRTVEIAKKYTDKVFYHKWNNDFASMRNKSISYCRGEWVLVLDADEVLDDVNELVDFLKMKKNIFKSAIVKIKNFTNNKDLNNYAMAALVRLFKKTPNLKYEGRVHEQPKVEKPVATTKIVLNHYGYCNDSYELMNYKFERNIELLFKDLNEGKNKIYTLYQLGQSYCMNNDLRKGLEYVGQAYDIVKNTIESNNRKKYIYIYHNYAVQLFGAKGFEKAIEVAKEALEIGVKNIDFSYIIANSLFCLNRNEEAIEYFEKYFQEYDETVNGYITNISMPIYFESKCEEVKKNMFTNSYLLKDYSKAIEIFRGLSEKNQLILMENFIYGCIKENNYKNIEEFIKKIEIKDEIIESIHEIFNRLINEYHKESINKLSEVLTNIDERLDLYIRSVINEEKRSAEVDIYRKFYNWKGSLLRETIKKDSNIEIEKLAQLNEKEIKSYTNYLCNDFKCTNLLHTYCKENFTSNNFKKLKFISLIAEELSNKNTLKDEQKEEILYVKLICNLKIIREIYNQEIYDNEEILEVINEEYALSIKLINILKDLNRDKLQGIKKIKILLERYSEYKDLISIIQKNISSEVVSMDMINEKENIIMNVQELINNNKLDEAEEILNYLSNIFSYDADILNAKGIINFYRGNTFISLVQVSLAMELKDNEFDGLFNLAIMLKNLDKNEDANYCFKKALNICENTELKQIILKEINC